MKYFVDLAFFKMTSDYFPPDNSLVIYKNLSLNFKFKT